MKWFFKLDTYLDEYSFVYYIHDFVYFVLFNISNEDAINILWFQISSLIKQNSSPCSGPKNPEMRHIRLVTSVGFERSFNFNI